MTRPESEIRFADPVRLRVPRPVAADIVSVCTQAMDLHEWSAGNIAAARRVLSGGAGQLLRETLVRRLSRAVPDAPGWAVVALPADLDDAQLTVAASGVLALLGTPFNSIDQDGALWIGRESSPQRDAASFGGWGPQAVHLDAPNVERVPDYTCLMILRADPGGGGASVIADLRAAVTELDEADLGRLRREVFFEGRADGLRGVGAPRLPFPVIDDSGPGAGWVRWADKLRTDPRNQPHADVLDRCAEAIARHTVAVHLERGQLLIADQQRIAHGRTALSRHDAPVGARRLLVQAKIRYDAAAPVQARPPAATEHGDA